MIKSFEEFVISEKQKDYFRNLAIFVNHEYALHRCYPPKELIFKALKSFDLNDLKVVILGQDPYHEEGQANGLAFSVSNKKLPPSLINIYKEMESDLNITVDKSGDLEYLAKQGVLLLNATLTVQAHRAFSHAGHGWEIFTDNLIKELNNLDKPIVFILWGNSAISKKAYLNNPKHLVLTSAHPSPLSANRGFFNSKPFSKTNEFLRAMGEKEIDWGNTKILI